MCKKLGIIVFFFIIYQIFFKRNFMMWHIFFIMWVAGAGKGTVIQALKWWNLQNLHIPLSYKTRAIRETEKNGVDAWFVSKEEFFYSIQAWEFLEYARVHDLEYYGTKLEDIFEKGLEQGKIVIKELDINWLELLQESHPHLASQYTTIFLSIPSQILPERIAKRGAFMSQEELKNRIHSAEIETQKAQNICNYIIDATQTQEDVFSQVSQIIQKKIT